MTNAYRFRLAQTGGPEMLEAEPIDIPKPAEGEVLIRHEAVGLNFIDTYHRSGLYPLPLPSGLGNEAAGVVEAVGPGVGGFAEGDRVGYFSARSAPTPRTGPSPRTGLSSFRTASAAKPRRR